MTVPENTNRLHAQLASMIELELSIEKKLKELIPIVSGHEAAINLLSEFQSMPKEHRQALTIRLNKISGQLPPQTYNRCQFPTDEITDQTYNPITTALEIAYTMFNRALIGYSVLHAHATRFLDSSLIEAEGTSYHLAFQFTKDYTRAIQQTTRLLHDVLLWELDRDGFECRCTCPSCGIGICLCSISGRYHLNIGWQEAGSFYEEPTTIYVQHPRQNSPAAKAGLQRGNVITTVEGQALDEWFDIQGVVRETKSRDEIRLEIRRESGALEEIILVKP